MKRLILFFSIVLLSSCTEEIVRVGDPTDYPLTQEQLSQVDTVPVLIDKENNRIIIFKDGMVENVVVNLDPFWIVCLSIICFIFLFGMIVSTFD